MDRSSATTTDIISVFIIRRRILWKLIFREILPTGRHIDLLLPGNPRKFIMARSFWISGVCNDIYALLNWGNSEKLRNYSLSRIEMGGRVELEASLLCNVWQHRRKQRSFCNENILSNNQSDPYICTILHNIYGNTTEAKDKPGSPFMQAWPAWQWGSTRT